MCQSSTPQGVETMPDGQHKQQQGPRIPQVAAAMCSAFEHGQVSTALAEDLGKLLPGCTAASVQLPLSEQLLVSKCNFLAANKDLALTVLPNMPTLATRAASNAAPASARRATSQSLLDVHSMATSSSSCYVTTVPILWHHRWQHLAAVLAATTEDNADPSCTHSTSSAMCARLCDVWACTALQAVFPCIGTLTVVFDQPPPQPLEQLCTLAQLSLTLAPQLLYAAQTCLRDTAIAVGVVPQYPHTFEYCPGEGFVPLEIEDYAVLYDDEEEDETMWAAVDESQPSTSSPKRAVPLTRCNQEEPSSRRDDDDVGGCNSVTCALPSVPSPVSKAKRMARITSTLHTIHEQHTASSGSSGALPPASDLHSKSAGSPDSVNKPHTHLESDSEKTPPNTQPRVLATAQQLQQDWLMRFRNQLIEWHYHVHYSSMHMRRDCVLLALLVLFLVAALGQSMPAFVMGSVLAMATLGLLAFPVVLMYVRDEAFLLLTVRQLMHVDWLQSNMESESLRGNMFLILSLNALSMAGLLQVRFFKQVRAIAFLAVVYMAMYAAGQTQPVTCALTVMMNPLVFKVLACSTVTFILEQAARARFARMVVNHTLPLTPLLMRDVLSQRRSN